MNPGPGVAALVYLGVTALLFHNLLPDLDTHLYSDLGDTLLNTSILAWNATETPLTDAWWNFPGYAPLSGVTAFTEHLLLAYPIASPVIWLTGNPVLAYNIVHLLALPLNGIAAYALARELLGRRDGPRQRAVQPALAGRVAQRPDPGEGGTGSNTAAFIGGLAFAFAPYQAVHLSHLQTMMAFGMPVGVLGVHRYLTTGRGRALALFAIGWLMTAWSNAYALVFFPVLVVLWSVWFGRHAWRRVLTLAGVAAVVLLPLVPLLWGYHVRQSAYGFQRQYIEATLFAADITGLASVYHRAAVWRYLLPVLPEEGALFPGLTIAALSVVALIVAVKGHRVTETQRSELDLRASVSPWLVGGWPRRLAMTAAVLTLIVLARIWTGPFGWHFGLIPLPPFSPYQLFTVAVVLFTASVLLTDGFRRAWARRDPVVFLAVAVVFLWLLSLGPEPEWSTPWRALIYGPYRLFMELPGVQSLRASARAWMPGVLCLAMLAAFGTQALLRWYGRQRRVLVAALVLLILVDGWFVDTTRRVPAPMREGAIPRGALVLDLPMDEGFWNAVPQYRGVLGGYRTINGYSGYEPLHFTPLRHAIADMRPDALESYRRLADLYVILRPGETPAVVQWIKSDPDLEHLYDTGDAAIYRLPRLEPASDARRRPQP